MSTGAQSIRNISILLSNPLTSERRRRDKITGTIGDDLFLNGLGADRFKGRGGTDVFLFDRKEKYGKKHADKIVDFNLNNDLIVFGNGRFNGMSDDPQFISVERKKNFKSAIKSDVEFVYWAKRGALYFNSNGEKSGFGNGGLFAILSGAPDLSVLSLGLTD